ncbi:MAG: prepilin-type N-terminal cleavage/methylation domain-containing protein [Sedimentisphaerales bacterium]|nr:prepilin-type N-terminal cleavage/methylation domain-containing protein [Sedimentisphaerales bacterium]
MNRRKGFTLVELMVVVVIVALLAALLIPMLTARVEAAKWAEGKAAAGTIATALRAYVVEKYELEPVPSTGIVINDIDEFMNRADLTGKYFDYSNYSIADVVYDPGVSTTGGYVVEYTIRVTAPDTTWEKQNYYLTHEGIWSETAPGGGGG